MSQDLFDFAFGDQEHLCVEAPLPWSIFEETCGRLGHNEIDFRVIRECDSKTVQRKNYVIIQPASDQLMQHILDAPATCLFLIVNLPEFYKTLVAWDNTVQSFEPFQLEHLISLKRDGCRWKANHEELFECFTRGQIAHLSATPILAPGRKFVELSVK